MYHTNVYHTVKDFLDDWNFEYETTVKVFSTLTDAALAQKVTPKGRSLGKLAWHITLSLSQMINRTGLACDAPPEDAPQPESASEIISTYKKTGAAFAQAIKESWKDSDLDQKIELYGGEQWARRLYLLAIVRHQIHHRAQMTILMRQAGLRVAGCYGPSFEEWTDMGREPQE